MNEIKKVIWPDDSYVAVGGQYGEDGHTVDEIREVMKAGGLGPIVWFEVWSHEHGQLGEINSHWAAATTRSTGLHVV